MIHRVAVVVIAVTVASGCAKSYVAVNYSSTVRGSRGPAELFSTPKYLEARTRIRTVAVQAPDNCVSETAAQQSGIALGGRQILKTDCGIWLSELEKTLVQAGFRVISWKELAQVITLTRTPGYKAAQTLGADAMFMVNSLENNVLTPDQLEDEALQYSVSNPAGDIIAPAMLDQKDRAAIRNVVRSRFKERSVRGLASTIDVSAVLAESGEAVWFYRRSITDATPGQAGARVLLRGRAGYWRPVLPTGVPPATDLSNPFADNERIQATKGGPDDATQHHMRALARVVMTDFVQQFTKGI